MKTFVIILAAALFTNCVLAQNSKYLEVMEENVLKIDTAKTATEWLNIANTMERVAEKETEEWLPSYYASLCYLMTGLFNEDKKVQAAYYDKAFEWVSKCESIPGIDTSEVLVLKAQIWSMQISLKPMKLGQTLGPLSDAALKDALRINPENPRAYMLRGQNFYYTPPMFGGDKNKAYEDFLKAKELFDTYEPTSSIAPRWGIHQTNYMIEECEKRKE